MGILSVNECFGGRAGTVDGQYARTYTRTFDVVTTDPLVGPVAVRGAAGIPAIGDTYTNGVSISHPLYEYDTGAFVNSIQVEAETNIAWKVTVQYGPYNTSEFGGDPTLWKIRVQFGGERTERVVDFDRDGNPLMNSAGDRFGDPVTVDDHITTLVVTRNELVSAFDIDLASLYSDTINDASWNGFAAGKCKMGIISTSEEQFDSVSGVWYYRVTYPIQISRTKWMKNLLDQGFNAIPDPYYGSSLPAPIMRGGQPIADPWPLNGAGGELPPGGTPVVLPYEVFDEADWSGLNIDLSLRLGL